MSRPRIVAADVRRTLSAEKAWAELSGDLPVALLFRPISYVLTPSVVRLGLSANAVTAFGLALALALPVLAVVGGAHAYAFVAALAWAFEVVDCVDGNVARITGTASERGALFEATVDAIFWIAFPLSIGVLAARSHGPLAAYGLTLSLGSIALAFLGRRVRDEFVLRYGTRAALEASRPARLRASDWLVMATAGLEHVYALVLVVAGLSGWLDRVPLVVIVYAGGTTLVSTWLTFRKAR